MGIFMEQLASFIEHNYIYLGIIALVSVYVSLFVYSKTGDINVLQSAVLKYITIVIMVFVTGVMFYFDLF